MTLLLDVVTGATGHTSYHSQPQLTVILEVVRDETDEELSAREGS